VEPGPQLVPQVAVDWTGPLVPLSFFTGSLWMFQLQGRCKNQRFDHWRIWCHLLVFIGLL
jgi:hypothetical protein